MKKLLCFILIVFVIFSASSAVYGETPVLFSVDKVSGGLGEVLSVDIKISENSNLTNMLLSLYYDSKYLKFKEMDVGDIVSRGLYEFNDALKERMKFAFISEDPITKGGTVMTISFEIINSDSENREVPLTLQVDELISDSVALEYIVENGSVTVDVAQTQNRGDVNGDGVFDEKDIEEVKDYLLGKASSAESFDLNSDGICDICEFIILRDML